MNYLNPASKNPEHYLEWLSKLLRVVQLLQHLAHIEDEKSPAMFVELYTGLSVTRGPCLKVTASLLDEAGESYRFEFTDAMDPDGEAEIERMRDLAQRRVDFLRAKGKTVQ